jgi:1,2-diacylglycerol 3-alpha-glucosyltransferase
MAILPHWLMQGCTFHKTGIDNQNGFLMHNSTESFASCLRKLISDPELIKKVGINASESITRSWESVTDEALDKYNHLIKRL